MRSAVLAINELTDDELSLAEEMVRRYGTYVTRVNPRTIKLRVTSEWPRYLRSWPLAVCWGDWDLGATGVGPFWEDKVQRLLLERGPHHETHRYREMVAELAQHGRTGWRTCHTVEEIDRYLLGVFDLYERIRTNGYEARPTPSPATPEITVCIGRDGAFTKFGQGTHRLAIARLLDLPSVPVVVDLMHWSWARRCLAERGGNSLLDAVQDALAAIAEQCAVAANEGAADES
jgi:hypothetical protein